VNLWVPDYEGNAARTIRNRQQDLGRRLDWAAGSDDNPPAGDPSMLVFLTAIETYPTSAQSFYACNPVELDGVEAEGATADIVIDNTTVIFAWNCGTQIPPQGTILTVDGVSGGWVFRYDVPPD
jgi:hypothetical protein